MCGIAGILSQAAIDQETVLAMGDSLSHRGPDDSGYWNDPNGGVALIHRRLSILDLSEHGHQPMTSPCDNYVIAFNGEIYNHIEIRKRLNYSSWQSSSDTETLLVALAELGIEKTLNLLVGMFAFALWDKNKKELMLARDRFGEKPLYYGWQNNVFLFGSELKALKKHKEFDREVDNTSVMLYLENGYVPDQHSIFKGINKLKQGSWLKVSLKNKECNPIVYWDLMTVAQHGQENLFIGDENSAAEKLEELLIRSVQRQQISDVPIGAFLSGGIDSSLIVALMQANSPTKVNTFSLGYEDTRYNEANYAKEVAAHLQTNHTEIYISPSDAMSVIPKLPEIYCEPFADTSQIPTYLISKLAAKNVKVAMSGDGGDELFGGYNHYSWVNKLWPSVSKVPMPLRSFASSAMMNIPAEFYNLWRSSSRFIPSNRVEKLSRFIKSKSMVEAYHSIVSKQSFSRNILSSDTKRGILLQQQNFDVSMLNNQIHQMMYLDSVNFLTNDVLVKLDRAAMSVGLETRVPLLDPDVVNFAWSLPSSMKIKDGDKKWLLKKILYKHVPKNLIDRPKMGFGIPLDEWLLGPLSEWAEHLLDKQQIHASGVFDEAQVSKLWNEHKKRKYNRANELWSILMFQSWSELNA